MQKNIVGIIIAKENSRRFPRKNYYIVKGKPLFIHSVNLMKHAGIKDIFVATNSAIIASLCYNEGLGVIPRGANVSDDNEGYFSVLKYAYKSVNKKYDLIVSVLANSLDHNRDAIKNGIDKFNDEHVSEVRSFDADGNQSGIFIFRPSSILDHFEMSGHMASILSNGKEIHYKKEIEDLKND